MQRRWPKMLSYTLILGVVLSSSLSLSGCDVLDFLGDILRINKGNEARAQDEGLVETLLIRAGSFGLTTDTILQLDTHVVVQDQVTIYKDITGSMSFIQSTGSSREFREILVDDIIIERPQLNQVTLIRRQ
jgi:hypothetical protein